MPQPSSGNNRYMPGLDGLRALSVFAVIAYHLNQSWASGGLLGVGVFFVLSGYLITDLLESQWNNSGRIDLKHFWLRRARRLLPAMFIMVMSIWAWTLLFFPDRLTSLRSDLLASICYVSNWWLIFHHVSYFESFGPVSPLGHLWSLAVEEQFYLVWPLLLTLGFRYISKRGTLTGLILVLIAGSALAMALLYEPGTDPSRVYYGTDTRAFSLLVGAVLALLWPSRKLSGYGSLLAVVGLDLVGGAGLIVVLLMMWKTSQYQESLYPGGLLLQSVAAAAAVAALAHPFSRLGRMIGWKPLRWLGVRSYGIYLWHYPIIMLTSPSVNTGEVSVLRVVCQAAACVVAAALSWRFIEEPILHGAIGKLWRRICCMEWGIQRRSFSLWTALSFAMLSLFLFYIGSTKTFTTAIASPSLPDPSSHFALEPVSSTYQEKMVNTVATEVYDIDTASSISIPVKPTDKSAPSDDWRGVVAIGDSVIVDAGPYLQELLPGIVVDGKIGRQMSEARAVVDQLKTDGKLGSHIIIELGTNGPFSKKQLESLLGSLGEMQQIVLVNTRVPRPWEDTVNKTLAEVAKGYPHTVLVDWYEASSDKDSYFYADGVHLKPDGAKFYASLLAKAVQASD